MAFSGLIIFSSMFYLPQFFQVALSYSPIHAGLFLIPVLGGQIVVSWAAVSALISFGNLAEMKSTVCLCWREWPSVRLADIRWGCSPAREPINSSLPWRLLYILALPYGRLRVGWSQPWRDTRIKVSWLYSCFCPVSVPVRFVKWWCFVFMSALLCL